MAKLLFAIVLISIIIADCRSLFSKKYAKEIVASKDTNEDVKQLLGPRTVMIITNVMYSIVLVILFFYFKHFVGFRLAFGYTLLQIVALVIADAFQFVDDMISNKAFLFLDKIVALIEIFMLVVIGYHVFA